MIRKEIPFVRRFFVKPFEDKGGWMLSIACGFIWINLRYHFPTVYRYGFMATGCYVGWIPWKCKEGDLIPGFYLLNLEEYSESAL